MGSTDGCCVDLREGSTTLGEGPEPPGPPREERRHGVRVPLELWIEEIAGDDVYFRRTGNVGEGGVFFDSAIPHPLGTIVTLKFTLPAQRETVIARGEVVSASEGGTGLGMGIKFLDVQGDGHDRIRDYVASA